MLLWLLLVLMPPWKTPMTWSDGQMLRLMPPWKMPMTWSDGCMLLVMLPWKMPMTGSDGWPDAIPAYESVGAAAAADVDERGTLPLALAFAFAPHSSCMDRRRYRGH